MRSRLYQTYMPYCLTGVHSYRLSRSPHHGPRIIMFQLADRHPRSHSVQRHVSQSLRDSQAIKPIERLYLISELYKHDFFRDFVSRKYK